MMNLFMNIFKIITYISLSPIFGKSHLLLLLKIKLCNKLVTKSFHIHYLKNIIAIKKDRILL